MLVDVNRFNVFFIMIMKLFDGLEFEFFLPSYPSLHLYYITITALEYMFTCRII